MALTGANFISVDVFEVGRDLKLTGSTSLSGGTLSGILTVGRNAAITADSLSLDLSGNTTGDLTLKLSQPEFTVNSLTVGDDLLVLFRSYADGDGNISLTNLEVVDNLTIKGSGKSSGINVLTVQFVNAGGDLKIDNRSSAPLQSLLDTTSAAGAFSFASSSKGSDLVDFVGSQFEGHAKVSLGSGDDSVRFLPSSSWRVSSISEQVTTPTTRVKKHRAASSPFSIAAARKTAAPAKTP